jgi:hypothetical protein
MMVGRCNIMFEWWRKLQKRPLGSRDEADKISTKSLVLSGFAFTAMTFVLGFFQKPFPYEVSIVVFCLLLSSVLFLVACEMADFSFYMGELVVAELLYHGSALLLFVGFAYFSYVQLSSLVGIVLILPLAVYLGLLYVTVKTVRKVIKRKRRD